MLRNHPGHMHKCAQALLQQVWLAEGLAAWRGRLPSPRGTAAPVSATVNQHSIHAPNKHAQTPHTPTHAPPCAHPSAPPRAPAPPAMATAKPVCPSPHLPHTLHFSMATANPLGL